MTEASDDAWDPRAPEVLADQVAAYDRVRRRCPIAHSDYLGWSVFGHRDVVRMAREHETFTSRVSTHLNVPNGMDPPEHTVFRAIVDRYYTSEIVDAFEPACRQIVRDLLAGLPRRQSVDAMTAFAELFALQVQSAYLGWPDELHGPLLAWTKKNRAATLRRDRAELEAIATEFDGYITGLLEQRGIDGPDASDDLTTRLLGERVDGQIGERALTDAELVSIIRNWTVGELSTIAASVGIVLHLLADRPDVQTLLRTDPATIPPAMEEILRIHPPFISSRRMVTEPTTLAGRAFEPGDRLTMMWASADRDEDVFGDPDEFRLDRPPEDNLVYGAGIHLCPGAPLARLELRVLTEEVLAATEVLELDPQHSPEPAVYPGSGFSTLPMILR